MQQHIYAIYGLVRVADEVVDTYRGTDGERILRELEAEVYSALTHGYSANPIVHSYALTARQFGIGRELIQPFFASMYMDLNPVAYTKKKYDAYIYGSAEVVGLMCLRVFLDGDTEAYRRLEPGARALGSAYQKVNFLRDIAADHHELGRIYFPGLSFDTFDDTAKQAIVEEIEGEFAQARIAIEQLPQSSRGAVSLSVSYYAKLLSIVKKTPANVIKQERIRVNNPTKAILFLRAQALRVVSYGR